MQKYKIFVIFKDEETVEDVRNIRAVVNDLEDACLEYASSCLAECHSYTQWNFTVKACNSLIVHKLVDILLSADEVDTYYMSRIKD